MRYPNWLECQITGIADYICRAPGDLKSLRELADEFRRAADRVEAEIEKRGYPLYHDGEGMFG